MMFEQTHSDIITSTLPELKKFASKNYESENHNVKALCILIELQVDLFNSLLLLMREVKFDGLVSICILARSIIENEGIVRHISDRPKRAKAYVDYVDEVEADIVSYVENRTLRSDRIIWSSSKIEQRVSLLSPISIITYDLLSNFVHGNNVHILYEHNDFLLELIGAILIPNFADLMYHAHKTLPLTETERSMLGNKIRGLSTI